MPLNYARYSLQWGGMLIFWNMSCSLESLIVALVLTNPVTWLWLKRPRTLDIPGTTNVRNFQSFAKGFFLVRITLVSTSFEWRLFFLSSRWLNGQLLNWLESFLTLMFFSLTDCSFLFISFQTLGGRSELEQNGKMRRAILIDQDVAELQTCRGHEGWSHDQGEPLRTLEHFQCRQSCHRELGTI